MPTKNNSPMKIYLKILFVVNIVLSLTLSSCYYDNEEDLYPGSNTCDNTNVTYSKSVAPVFAGYCNTCHDGSNPNTTILTNTYAADTTNRIKILGAINHTGPIPMPPGGSLSTCDLEALNIWYENGYPNN